MHVITVPSNFLSLGYEAREIAPSNFLSLGYEAREIATRNEVSTVMACKGDLEKLSGRERRRLKNQRREEALKSKPSPKEILEKKIAEKSEFSKLGVWERIEAKGTQWWTLNVVGNRVKSVSDSLSKQFPLRFPDVPFQVFIPEIPARRERKDGSFSKAKKKLFPCTIFVRCSLNREIVDFIKNFENVRGFIGRDTGLQSMSIIEPTPVSSLQIDALMKKTREAEEAFQREILEMQRLNEEVAEFDSFENDNIEDSKQLLIAPRMNARDITQVSTLRKKSDIWKKTMPSQQKVSRKKVGP